MDKVFSIWPTAADLAREIGVNPVTVRSWRARMSIPARHDFDIVKAAGRRGALITLEDLAVARSNRSKKEAS